MATTVGGFSVSNLTGTQAVLTAVANRQRFISRRAGRALEILGHAIEYLTDEFVQEATQVSADDPRVQAIQILMALNREIYFECPVKVTVAEHLRSILGIRPT